MAEGSGAVPGNSSLTGIKSATSARIAATHETGRHGRSTAALLSTSGVHDRELARARRIWRMN